MLTAVQCGAHQELAAFFPRRIAWQTEPIRPEDCWKPDPLPDAISHPLQWAVFRQIDDDDSGKLDREEIHAYLAALGHQDMADELIRYLDRDGDGDIDFPECAIAPSTRVAGVWI